VQFKQNQNTLALISSDWIFKEKKKLFVIKLIFNFDKHLP